MQLTRDLFAIAMFLFVYATQALALRVRALRAFEWKPGFTYSVTQNTDAVMTSRHRMATVKNNLSFFI